MDRPVNLIAYNPWKSAWQLGRESNRMLPAFGLLAEEKETATFNTWAPAIDIKEEKSRYLLSADLPGVEPDQLEITMDKSVLTLLDNRRTRTEDDRNKLRRSERVSGKFFRRFNLPDSADTKAISADYRQGVLEISIPKRAEAQPQRIQINVN